MLKKVWQLVGGWFLLIGLALLYILVLVPVGLFLRPWSDRLQIRGKPRWLPRRPFPPMQGFARREY